MIRASKQFGVQKPAYRFVFFIKCPSATVGGCFYETLRILKEHALGRIFDKITPRWVKKYVALYREKGFKATVKEAGWKVVIGVILYYLVRDVILYIIIPYYIFKEVSQ